MGREIRIDEMSYVYPRLFFVWYWYWIPYAAAIRNSSIDDMNGVSGLNGGIGIFCMWGLGALFLFSWLS